MHKLTDTSAANIGFLNRRSGVRFPPGAPDFPIAYMGLADEATRENREISQHTPAHKLAQIKRPHSTCCPAMALAFFAPLNSAPAALSQAIAAARDCEETKA